MREADADDRKEGGFIVGLPRGFEQLEIAVYGVGNSGDAVEAAIEWLSKHHPESLTDAEKDGNGEATATKIDPYADMTAEDEARILREIANEKGVDWLLSVGDVYSIVLEELNNDILDRWTQR